MEGSIRDLALLRLDKAEEMLGAAEKNYYNGELKTSLNAFLPDLNSRSFSAKIQLEYKLAEREPKL